MEATRNFGRLVALVLALAALAVTAGSARATGGDERSDKAKQEHSDTARAEAKAAAKAEAEAEKKAEAEARAAAKAEAKAEREAEKKAEAEARASAKAQAKAAIAARVAAKAQAKAAARAAAEAQNEAEKAARAQAKAAAKAAHQAQMAARAQANAAAQAQAKGWTKSQSHAQTPVTTPTPKPVPGSTPNQGEESKVLTVTGASCAGTVVAGGKVEGGMGRTITLGSTLPIVKVTVKSGNGATVVSSSFSADFKSATITLSKDVSNYVVWTCGAAGTQTQNPTHPQHPGSGPNQGDESKVLTVTGASCPNAVVAGAKVEGKMGQTVTLTSTLPIVQVTLKSGNEATVVSSSFSADFKSVTITLSKDVSNYVVWTCGAATVQTTTTTGGDTKPENKGGNETKPETKAEGGNDTKPETKTEVAAETKTVTTVKTTPAAASTQPQGQPQSQPQGQAAGQADETQPASGDVLGATASAPEAIQETGESGTLPFTGIPLWIAALFGLGLLASGLVLRRAAHH